MNAQRILGRSPVVRLVCFVSMILLVGLPVWAQAAQTNLPVAPDQQRQVMHDTTAVMLQMPFVPPTPPMVTISLSGANVVLSWAHAPSNAHYQIWRSSAPYFVPDETGSTMLADMPAICPNGICTYTDFYAVGGNFAYVVRAFTNTGLWVDSVCGDDRGDDKGCRTGKFEFAMVAGE